MILVLLLLLLVPFVYLCYPLRLTAKSLLQVFLFLHTVYLAYLLVLPQANVFIALNVPLSTPAVKLRSLLVGINGGPLSEHLDTLVRRLNELEMRALYVRLGHKALTCPFCVTQTEFFLYALPQILLGYVLEASVIGLVCASFTSVHHTTVWLNQQDPSQPQPPLAVLVRKLLHPTPRQEREMMVWVLVVGLAVEAYVAMSVPIAIGPGVKNIMWHDLLTQIRLGAFIVLPLIAYTILSSSSNSISPSTVIPNSQEGENVQETQQNPSIKNLVSIHSHLRFLRLLYPAVLRSDKLSERVVKRMATEKRVGEYAMNDADVRAWLVEQHAKIQHQNGGGAVGEEKGEDKVVEGDEVNKKREQGKQALRALRQTARQTAEALSQAVGL